MLDVKIGDKVTRFMHNFRLELWRNEGHVVAVDDKKITCMIMVDQPRKMMYDRRTGISLAGKHYGWIEKVSK